MQNDDAPQNRKNADAKEDASMRDDMTNDKYFADFVANAINATTLLQIVLPKQVFESLDMSTLQVIRTRDVGADGVEKIGDAYFLVDTKDRPGKVKRRAVFVIAAEHKTKDEKYLPVQLLGYVSKLLDRMVADPDTYADENGFLPTPYVVVFSQDKNPKEKSTKLNDILWTLPGLEDTVPNFAYQTVYVNDIPLDVIRKCEPAMRTFLYLTQIANKKHTTEEDAELAATFRRLLDESPSDERLRQCVEASLNYFVHLQKLRPGMLSLTGLRKEIEKQKGEPMENAVLLFFEKEVSERCEQAMQTGWQNGMENSIYKTIYNNLLAKYGKNSVSEELRQKLDEINYYPALEEIQLASWMTPSLDDFEKKVTKIVNKYQDEIQELKR